MSKILEAKKLEYLAEIRGWNWEKIKSHCESETHVNENGDREGSCLIGGLLSVPSGKYYQPFACSNVDPCPHCEGIGKVVNLNGNEAEYDRLKVLSTSVTQFLIAKYGTFGTWPPGSLAFRDSIYVEAERNKPTHECPFCGGIGSEEAAWDELWLEALAEVAEENGGWIDYEDDQFFCMIVEGEDDPEDDIEIEEDDFIFADPGFTRNGKRVAETEEELQALMDAEHFWPNVWWISDHGNVSRYVWDSHNIRDL